MLREQGRGLQRLLNVGLRADGKEEEAGDFGRRAEGQERGSSSPVAENLMTKIVLSASRDIPLNKLVLSQANVRRIKAGVSVEELAEDIARRGLLQSLSVRPVRDGQGQETGRCGIAGTAALTRSCQCGRVSASALRCTPEVPSPSPSFLGRGFGFSGAVWCAGRPHAGSVKPPCRKRRPHPPSWKPRFLGPLPGAGHQSPS